MLLLSKPSSLTMKHYHLYIEAGRMIDENSHFYKVSIGASQQADRDYLFLVAHAADHGHYFALWSADVDDFLAKIKKSLNLDFVPLQPISARDLVRHIKAGTIPPLSPQVLNNADTMRKFFNLDYLISSNLRRRP